MCRCPTASSASGDFEAVRRKGPVVQHRARRDRLAMGHVWQVAGLAEQVMDPDRLGRRRFSCSNCTRQRPIPPFVRSAESAKYTRVGG